MSGRRGGAASLARPIARAWSLRRLWVVAHRWAGLATALFLIVAGLTGSVLPFEEALTFATRPDVAYVVPPRPGARPLDGIEIAQRVERQTGGQIGYIPLEVPRDRVLRLFVAARPGHASLPYDVAWADPYTGHVRLTYRWGGVRDGPENIVPFLYSVHYGFVAGAWGMWVFGLAALIWTIDCFIGFYLTLPLAGAARGLRTWLARWRPAWQVRRAGGHKTTFDLHRAGGLWVWPLLLVFAWSAVGLLLPQASTPVMRLFGASTAFTPTPLARPLAAPPIGLEAAVRVGDAELRSLGRVRGFVVRHPTSIAYDPASGLYRLGARTSLDRTTEGGSTTLWIDGRTGRPVRFDPPLGHARADAFMQWLIMLHMAQVFGLPWRVFVSALGLVVTMLSATGVMLWWRRRSARRRSRSHHAAAPRAQPARGREPSPAYPAAFRSSADRISA